MGLKVCEDETDGIAERGSGGTGEGGGFGSAGLPGRGIAVNEDRRHGEAVCSLDVGEGIADEEAVPRRDFGKIAEGLKKEAGLGLAAVALIFVVRAEVESIDAGAVVEEMLLERGVKGIDIAGGVVAEGDAALVADHDGEESGAVEGSNGGGSAREPMEVFQAADVMAFGRLAVEDAVAVDEDAAEMRRQKSHEMREPVAPKRGAGSE
jgi:hypothetical protein